MTQLQLFNIHVIGFFISGDRGEAQNIYLTKLCLKKFQIE